MKIKLTLATATAFSVLMVAAALADSNTAYLSQSGNANSGLVDQTSGDFNAAGLTADALTQSGNGNKLHILQTGSFNAVGTFGTGFDQVFGGNSADISQSTGGNRVNQILQSRGINPDTGLSSGLATGSGLNKIVITQNGGDSNAVSAIRQATNIALASGVSNSAIITQSGIGNRVGSGRDNANSIAGGISQTSYGPAGNNVVIEQTGNLNQVLSVEQRGGDFSSTIRQDGQNNFVGLTDQRQYSNVDNNITLDFTGNGNGAGASVAGSNYLQRGSFATGGFAASVGLTQGDARQYWGGGNNLDYLVVGSQNKFGFEQNWNNYIQGTVSGDSNDVAVWQNGDDNSSTFSQNGNNNNLGVKISGNNVTGPGNWNVVDAAQSGGLNNAGVVIVGGNNHLSIQQDQTGATANVVNVSITGNNNNNYPVTASVGGEAETVWSGLRASDASFNAQGDLFQDGSGNALTAVVAGDLNSFVTYQKGDANSISYTATGGSNQAVVAQLGNNNASVVTQLGSSNNVGILQ